MKLLKGQIFLILVMFLVFLPYDSYSSSTVVKSSGTYQEPSYWPTTGWRTSSPDDQGVSSVKIQEIYEYLNSTVELSYIQIAMHSLLIIRNGYLIHENYFSSFAGENTRGNIYSVTKSITSALIGIAIEEGYIGNVEDLILSYFPNRTILNRDTRKESITIEDLLTMRAGFNWDETNYKNPSNDYSQMYSSPNPVQYVLDKPMTSSPGSTWVYNTGNSHVLSAIIDTTTGIGTKEFAQTRLFNPLGIDRPDWSIDFQNIPYGGSNLRITPRQMAKFGFLYLNNGSWDGQQIVPKEWVTASTHSTDTSPWYGYQWWIEPSGNSFNALGYLGQRIAIIPDYNMVVVFTANTNAVGNLYSTLLEEYIMPAIGYILPTTTTTEAQSSPFYLLPMILVLSILVAGKKQKMN